MKPTSSRQGMRQTARSLCRWALVCLLGSLSLGQAVATVRMPTDASGLGSELMFLVHEPVAKLTYTLDLGVNMDDFFAQAQSDAGYQRFWVVDRAQDAAWNAFLTRTASLTTAGWMVWGIDDLGNTTAGAKRLFTTAAQGVEGQMLNMTNPKLQGIINDPITGAFFTETNKLGTHYDAALGGLGTDAAQVAIQGSGLNDPSNGGTTNGDPTDIFRLKFGATLSMGSPLNAIGQSSWFYYATRSGTSNLEPTARARIDEFDNLGADGYWGFTRESAPEGSQRYLLSYTLPAFVSRTEQAAAVVYGNNFARMAGILSLSSAAGKGDTVLSLAEGFLRGVAGGGASAQAIALPQSVRHGQAVLAVPEPQTWGLMLAGLWVVGGAARRRRG